MIDIRALLGLTYYTSKIDEFLMDFDKSHPRLSASQREEVEKYNRVYKLRDDTHAHDQQDKFWDQF